MSKRFKTTYDRPPHRGLECKAPSLVQSQFARDTDINFMIQRALGGDPSVFARGASEGIDALEAPDDFHDAMNRLARGDTAWEELPLSLKQAYGSKEAFINAVDSFVASQSAPEVSPEVSDNKSAPDETRKPVTPVGAEDSKPKSAL